MKKNVVFILALLTTQTWAVDVYQCSKGFIVTIIDKKNAQIEVTNSLDNNLEIPTYRSQNLDIQDPRWNTEQYSVIAYTDENKRTVLFSFWGYPKNNIYSLDFTNPKSGEKTFDMNCTEVKI